MAKHHSKPSVVTAYLNTEGHVCEASVSAKATYDRPAGWAVPLVFGSKGEAEKVKAEIMDALAEQHDTQEEIQRLERKLKRQKDKLLRTVQVKYSDHQLELGESRPDYEVIQQRLNNIESKVDKISTEE